MLEGQELLEMEPEARAAAGLFLAFQYPVEIPGVGNMTFLRTAVNAQRKARNEPEMSAGDFLKVVRAKAKTLKIDAEMLKRPVNVGFSGGEKKRNEILQMAMLEPKMCILDETDSGLDVDAMKLVSEGVNALRGAGRSFLVITHYQRLLDHIKPDFVHILSLIHSLTCQGRLIKTSTPDSDFLDRYAMFYPFSYSYNIVSIRPAWVTSKIAFPSQPLMELDGFSGPEARTTLGVRGFLP